MYLILKKTHTKKKPSFYKTPRYLNILNFKDCPMWVVAIYHNPHDLNSYSSWDFYKGGSVRNLTSYRKALSIGFKSLYKCKF